MNILAICGSIRHNSTNHAALAAVRSLLPEDCGWEQFEIKSLPFFEPDNQWSENAQVSVKKFRLSAGRADVILIATPEYAHGIPGVLKNALEWCYPAQS